MASVYEINKGINRPIEFKGFRAQYVTYLAIGLVVLLLFFAVGYIVGIPSYILVLSVGVGGFAFVSWMYKLSHKYGEFGLMKTSAYRLIPVCIICHSRRFLLQLNHKGGDL